VTDDDPAYSETVTESGDAPDTSAVDVYTVTYDAPADAAGNTPIQQSITITVDDTTPPTFDVDGNVVDYPTGVAFGGVYTAGIIANEFDISGIASSVVGGETVDTNSPAEYLVTYTVTDNNGLVTIITETVTVDDQLSSEFSHGTTFGEITSGQEFLTVTNVATNVVNISSTGDATVDVCGISTLSLTDGDSVDLECGSITIKVLTGTLEVEFVTDDGTTVTTTLDSGSDVTFDATEITLTNNSSTDVELIVDGEPITIPSGETIIVSQSPLEQKSSVITTLTSLKGTDDKLDKKIDKVIKHITKSTDDKFWSDDGTTLDDKKSKKVFDEEKKAVKGLMKIVKKGDSGIDTEISAIITILVDVDRELAQDAIKEAKIFEGEKKVDKEIEKAEKELAKGDKEASKGKFDKAIDKYKKAWEHAQKALKKVKDPKEPKK